MGKKLLVIGQGGREHALVWKLAQSPEVEKIYAAPGNPGIAQLAECVNIEVHELDKLQKFAADQAIDLTVVGPEAPLMDGIVDRFQKAGLKIFGPCAAAAQLEGSKVFAKQLLAKYKIPTAAFEVCEDIEKAYQAARTYTDQGLPVVVKADGLAAGKGVVVASGWEEARQAIDDMMRDRTFGEAGARIVVEECLQGEELSVFALCDGKHYIILMSAQDHKRVFDNDEGPNTGGMGAYVNPPLFTPELRTRIETEIIRPIVDAMAAEGNPYQGVLYAGLMITTEGPKVLEFNARFGDPETQVLMPMIGGDLLPILECAAEGCLQDSKLEILDGGCVGVVLASGGYPGSYAKGKVITGLDKVDKGTVIFHAGTSLKQGELLTNGGRVLAVVCRGADTREAIENVYHQVAKINFEGMHYRRDIGRRAL